MKALMENWQAAMIAAAIGIFVLWFVWEQLCAICAAVGLPFRVFFGWLRLRRLNKASAELKGKIGVDAPHELP